MDGYSVDGTTCGDTSFSMTCLVMASDVEHIPCGTFSSPSEDVASTTSALVVDCVVHANCDIGHTLHCQLSAFIGGVLHLIYDACYLEYHARESCDACPPLRATEVI